MQVITTLSGLNSPIKEGSELITVSTTVQVLTASKYIQRGSEATRDMGNARFCIIQVQGSRIRVWFDATNPAGDEGFVYEPGSQITLGSEQQMKDFRAILDDTAVSDAVLAVGYWR